LRQRAEDIPLLIRNFTARFSARMHKAIRHASEETITAMTRHAWPGNVRELQNFIERAVILSPGKVLRAPLAELAEIASGAAGEGAAAEPTTLRDAEREHILRGLAETNWILGGTKGAAARLGLKRTTLFSMMQRLGISRAQA